MPDQHAAKSPQDLLTRDHLLSMSGSQFMESVRDGNVAGAPIAAGTNMVVHFVEDGRVAFRGTPQFEHCNPVGAVHGGWYGTMLDSCMACAVMTKVPAGSHYTTLEYKINITRPIPIGTEVEALGVVQHGGRSTGVANGEIRGVEDGRLYATGSTTCIIMKVE